MIPPLFLSCLLIVIKSITSETITIYVSPNGDDSNNGFSPNTPFQTIQYAQNVIVNNTNLNNEFIVNLMNDAGAFYLTNPLNFRNSINTIKYQSYSINNNNDKTIISAGLSIPSDCWKLYNVTSTMNLYSCNISQMFNNTVPHFKSIRINNKRAIPCRYPKVNTMEWYNYPYTDKGWLTIHSLTYLGTSKYRIAVDNSDLIPSLKTNGNYRNGNINIFPDNSWINILISDVKPYDNGSPAYSHFEFTCPEKQCSSSSGSAKIGQGNRFYFYNVGLNVIPLQEQYEWHYNTNLHLLHIALSSNKSIDDITKTNVVIPINNKILYFDNSTNITLQNLQFMDTQFNSYGYQLTGWNTKPNQPHAGIPSDSSIYIYNCTYINMINCSFNELSGSGILLSNNSHNINIISNKFNHLGQSGILLVGDTKYQSKEINIFNNTFNYIGEILACASAIYLSSSSLNTIQYNNITYSSRWGIALRSGTSSHSNNNIIKYNIINYTGLQTSSLGGISCSGFNSKSTSITSPAYTNNSIIYNCIANTVGKITNSEYKITTPVYSFGIYLDNWSSGYYIYGNIFHNQVLTGINIHGGFSNWIQNNIYYNSTEQPGTPGGFGQISFVDITKDGSKLPFNNTLIKNIIFYENKNSKIIANKDHAFEPSFCSQIDYNLYYNPKINISNITLSGLTPAGNKWIDWLNDYNKKYDQNSLVDINPEFVDPENGNFNLKNESVVIDKLNFEPIPTYIASNC